MSAVGVLAGRDAMTAGPKGLTVEAVPAAAIAEQFGTPVSVLSLGQILTNVQQWRSALETAWPIGPTLLCPSFKANTNVVVWRRLAAAGLGCDVFGANELRAALAAGMPAERISLNGTTKPTHLLDAAVRHGVRITVDEQSSRPVDQDL